MGQSLDFFLIAGGDCAEIVDAFVREEAIGLLLQFGFDKFSLSCLVHQHKIEENTKKLEAVAVKLKEEEEAQGT